MTPPIIWAACPAPWSIPRTCVWSGEAIGGTSPCCHWGQCGLRAMGNLHCKFCSVLSLWPDAAASMCQQWTVHRAREQRNQSRVYWVLPGLTSSGSLFPHEPPLSLEDPEAPTQLTMMGSMPWEVFFNVISHNPIRNLICSLVRAWQHYLVWWSSWQARQNPTDTSVHPTCWQSEIINPFWSQHMYLSCRASMIWRDGGETMFRITEALWLPSSSSTRYRVLYGIHSKSDTQQMSFGLYCHERYLNVLIAEINVGKNSCQTENWWSS